MALDPGEKEVGEEKEVAEPTLRDTIVAAVEQEAEEREPKEVKEEKEVKEVKEPKEVKEVKEPLEKEVKEVKEPPVAKAAKEVTTPKEVKEIPDPKIASRAPGSWKPAAREKWAGIPPEIQQEVLRREREMAQGFNETTNVRKFHEQFNRVVAPYQNVIAAEGGNTLDTVNKLFYTAGALYSGSPAQKVAAVAALIKNFAVDLPMLDSVLSGQAPVAGAAQGGAGAQDATTFIRNEIQNALAPLLRGQQAGQQKLQGEVSSEIDAFATDPKNEFFEDVRETMADLLEVAAKQGKSLDLSTAYQRAIMMHSDIADVVAGRKLQEKAAQQSVTAAAARRRAVSVKGAPAKVAGSEKGASLRADLENAISQLSE